MNTYEKLGICAVASLMGHFGLARALDQLPPHVDPTRPRVVEIKFTQPPPEPPPEPEKPKPPEPKAPDPPKQVHERPKTAPAAAVVHDIVPHDNPTPDAKPTPGPTMTTPVFGYDLKGTSGGTVPVPAGNTTATAPTATKADVKPLAPPVAAFEVTKMPIPQGRCSGKYTDEARTAAIEGTVVLDLIVDERGHAREITVVEGLGGGLTKAAIAALTGCQFSPGEKQGKPVAVRVRGFKIRFVLQESR